jgi:phage terminase large subunit-like protein
MLQNPVAAGVRDFKDEWFLTYSMEVPLDYNKMSKCIIIDSANAKKKDSDYTTMLVMGLASDGCWYLLDGVYDRLDLSQRTRALFTLVRGWWPLKNVWWEQQGAMSDVAHVRLEMNRELFHFPITELHHNVPKVDRIRRLVPEFEQGRIIFPRSMLKRRVDGTTVDLTVAFLEQYKNFPIVRHDDFIDCLADIKDPEVMSAMKPPKGSEYGAHTHSAPKATIIRRTGFRR